MNLNTHYQEYTKDLEQKETKLNQARSLCSRISFWRGLSFLTAAVLFFCAYENNLILCYFSAAAAVFAFLILIRYHNRLKQQISDLTNYCLVLKDYLARFDDEWKSFTSDGKHYINDNSLPDSGISEADLEAEDLDLFGKHSLFQYICTAGTIYGQDQLAEWLRCPDKAQTSIDEIKTRQQAAAELSSSKPEFTMQFETAARSLRGLGYDAAQKIMQDFFKALSLDFDTRDQKQSHEHAQSKSGRQLNTIKPAEYISIIVPAVTLLFLAAAILNIYREAATPLAVLFMTIQLLAALLTYHHHNSLLTPVYKMNRTIAPYRRLMELIEQASFDSPYLKALQNDLTYGSPDTDPAGFHKNTSNKKCQKNDAYIHTASNAFKELEKIADSVVTRHNLFALILYNSLFLYDFYCVRRFLAWKQKYKHLIPVWLTAIGRVEALISLGVISRTKNTCTMPDLSDQIQPQLSGTLIQHPLIRESAAVGNDFDLQCQTCIITGSNMSGKTTFMRSIGLNLVLAYAGGYCTAESFHASFMEIYTSMRTQDNVSEGISTFYAELLRIKRMIDAGRRHVPMISLIDEIYKGTNSKDRIYAAMATVKTLSQPTALTMITTHDLELCDLEYDEQIEAENYHFTEYYEQNEIRFDYKIRKGRSTTTNARYLLRMAGILDEAADTL